MCTTTVAFALTIVQSTIKGNLYAVSIHLRCPLDHQKLHGKAETLRNFASQTNLSRSISPLLAQ